MARFCEPCIEAPGQKLKQIAREVIRGAAAFVVELGLRVWMRLYWMLVADLAAKFTADPGPVRTESDHRSPDLQ